jgi:hypothetical protein
LEGEDAIGMEMDVAAAMVMRISKQPLLVQIMIDQTQLEKADI